MIDDVASVWTLGAVLSVVIGGIIGGIAMQAVHPFPASRVRAFFQGVILVWLGILFWVGRIAEAIARDDVTAGRQVGAFVLWCAFSVIVGLSAYTTKVIRVRRRHG